MRNMIVTAAFLASSAFAQLAPPKQQATRLMAVADMEVEPSRPVYIPGRDPQALTEQGLYDAMELAVFGIVTHQETWNLWLDAPVTPEDGAYMTGTHPLGFPFEVEFSSVNKWPVANGEQRGIWTGRITGPYGSFVLSGFYAEDARRSTIIPIYALRDQATAHTDFTEFMSFIGGSVYDGRMWACNTNTLDNTATLQLNQGIINATACRDSHNNWVYRNGLFCAAVGFGSCWFSFGIGCIGGFVCEVGILINEVFWQRDFENEGDRTTRCLCLESQWRDNNPGQPLPSPSCGNFNCPDNVTFDVPLFK